MTRSKPSYRFPKLLIVSALMLLGVHAFALDWSPYGDPPSSGKGNSSTASPPPKPKQKSYRQIEREWELEQEKQRKADEARWQLLNDKAANGDETALRDLISEAMSRERMEKARPGIEKAAQNGSHAARFLNAALDYKTADDKKDNAGKQAALTAMAAMKGYAPAELWAAYYSDGEYEAREKRALNVALQQKDHSAWSGFVAALERCRQGYDCKSDLQRALDRGIVQARAPLALAYALAPSQQQNLAKARELLESIGPNDPMDGDASLLLSLMRYRGWGGALNIKGGEQEFKRNTSYWHKLASIAFLGPKGNGCGKFRWQPNQRSHTQNGAYSGGFGISEPAIEPVNGATKQEALDSCNQEASTGHADALAWLGVAYSRCLVSCDTQKAREAFIKAADAGSSYADHWLIAYVDEKSLERARISRDRLLPSLDSKMRLAAEYNLLKAGKRPKEEFLQLQKKLLAYPNLLQDQDLLSLMVTLVKQDGIPEPHDGAAVTWYAIFVRMLADENTFSNRLSAFDFLKKYSTGFSAFPDHFWKRSTDPETFFLGSANCASWSKVNIWGNKCSGRFLEKP